MNKKGFQKYIPLLCLALLAIVLAGFPLMTMGEDTEENKPSVLSGTVERQDMEKNIFCGGPLAAAEAVTVSIPSGVSVTRAYVNNGDTVSEGDAIAETDRLSVMAAITSVQSTLEELRSEIDVYWHTSLGVYTMDGNGQMYINGAAVDSYQLANSAELAAYFQQHGEYEEMMRRLFLLYQNGTVTAPASGMIDGLDTSVAELSSLGGGKISLLAANTPYGDDDRSYQNYIGAVQSVSEAGIELLMNPTAFPIEDYLELSAVNTDPAAMTEAGCFTEEAPIFAYVNGEWVQLRPDALKSGDLLIFALDDSQKTVWLVKLTQENPSEKAEEEREDTDFGGNTGFSGAVGGTAAGTQTKSASLYSTSEKTLCSIVPLDEMSITATVDEQDAAALSVGKTVTVTLHALPGQSFVGTVTEISAVGDNNGGSSKFEFTVSLPYSENMLPGMNASVIINVGCIENALTIPAAAIWENDGRSFVYLGYDGEEDCLASPAEIETGFTDGEAVELLSGLTEGQQIYYEYYDTLPLSSSASPVRTGGLSLGTGFFRRGR